MNKWVAGALLLGFLFLALISVLFGNRIRALNIDQLRVKQNVDKTAESPNLPTTNASAAPTQDSEKIVVFAQDLEVPWALVFLPDNSMLVTERPGRVRFIDANGK